MELRRYWEIICRRKWLVIQSVILLPIFTYIFLITMSPVYQSKAKLIVEGSTLQQKYFSEIPGEIGIVDFFSEDDAMGSIEEMLESYPVVGEAIKYLDIRDNDGDLYQVDDFVDSSVVSILLRKKGVEIDNVSDSETFDIVGYSDTPADAKELVEKIVENFKRLFSERYKETAAKARKALELQISDLQKRLFVKEKILQEFKIKFDVFNLETQTETLLTEISDLETEKNEVARLLEEALANIEEIRNASLQDQSKFKSVSTSIEDSDLIIEYKSKLLNLESKLAASEIELTAEHPDVKALKNQINIVQELLRKELRKNFAAHILERDAFYDSLVTQYIDSTLSVEGNKAMKKTLSEQIKERKILLSQIPKKQLEYNQLTRDFEGLENIYNSLVMAAETAKSVEAMDLSNVINFQPPILYENTQDNLYFPPAPKKYPLLLVIATILGVFFGCSLVFFLEYIDESIVDSKQIANILGQRVLGTISKVRWKKLNIRNWERSKVIDDVYNLLANCRLFKGADIGKVISVVSPMRKEGKSMLSAFMAAAMSRMNKKVILIDGSMRRPSQNHIFYVKESRIGLTNYLLSDIEIEKIIYSTSIENLDIITNGSISITNPQNQLGSERFSSLVKELSINYDAVVIDTPSFYDGSDPLIISTKAEDVIFVAEQGVTSQKRAQGFMNALGMADISILGVVLNKVFV